MLWRWNRTYTPAIFFLSNYKSDVNTGVRNGGQQNQQGQMVCCLESAETLLQGRCGIWQFDSISPHLQSIIIPDLHGFGLKSLQVTQLY